MPKTGKQDNTNSHIRTHPSTSTCTH